MNHPDAKKPFQMEVLEMPATALTWDTSGDGCVCHLPCLSPLPMDSPETPLTPPA